MDEAVKVFIVVDLRLLREGLVALLAAQTDIAVVGAAADSSRALGKIRELRPAVALIHMSMPGKDGLTITQALRQEAPEVKVIILAMPDQTGEIMACIEAGAAGYVLQDAGFDSLADTIRAVQRGESLLSPRMVTSLFAHITELASTRPLGSSNGSVRLTARELDIISEIAEGLSNKEIAQRLSIGHQTVKNHVHNILDKLQLHNRREAVRYAQDRNLLRK